MADRISWGTGEKRNNKGITRIVMFTRKTAAYIVALAAIMGVANSLVLIRRNRRIAKLEERMGEVECDVKATVAVERMRTVLPFPADHVVASGEQCERTSQA